MEIVISLENMTDSVEIPTENAGFSTMTRSIMVSPYDCVNDGQPSTRNGKIGVKTAILPFWLLVVVAVTWGYFLRAHDVRS